MNLDDTDFALVAYVFAPKKSSDDELFVRTNKFHGTRSNLKSLIPKGWVLDLVATMLTLEGSQIHWYLLATFSQFILEGSTTVETLRRYYKNEYMSTWEIWTKGCKRNIFSNSNSFHIIIFKLFKFFWEGSMLMADPFSGSGDLFGTRHKRIELDSSTEAQRMVWRRERRDDRW
ncbi:hypothetical protein PIB30_053638 [Stylosanthes scabra]|uniref:DNA methylase N-4/N-6 domain-containing protein n=1 Tax=Stylosanthes scabra TaxID=79078 RepID=A0ABU6WH52_9FABA|nr:hypothetical protein [Stylosanthes scabra]